MLIQQVCPGLWRITAPLPFGPPEVNVYLAAQCDGYMLIDTAIGTNDAFIALDQGLKSIGIAWTQVRRIVISHLHPDHTGLVPRIRELSQASVLMSRDDSILLDQVTGGNAKAEELRSALARGGVDSALAETVTATYIKIVRAFPRFQPDEFLRDGEALATRLGTWRVILTPGHAPGHVCLFNEDRKLLFSGDQVIEDVTPHIGWLPHRDSLGEFLESMERLKELDVDTILPSHGAPFTGLRAWIDRAVRHHEDRCRQLEMSLREGSRTVAQLVASVWPRDLRPLDYQLAFTEILSHLEYMAARGRVFASGKPVERWNLQ